MVRHKIHTQEHYTVNYIGGLELRIAAITTNGMKRRDNEDNFEIVVPTYNNSGENPEALIVVADGMGGHANGQEASRIVVETYREQFMEEGFNLLSAAETANERIVQQRDGSGSAVVALHLRGQHITFQNVGDARLYRYNGHLEQLTKDQSVVQQLADAGQIRREDAGEHLQAHFITNSIGVGFDSEMSKPYEPQDIQSMDRYLLCSDGLWDMLTSREIEDIFRQEKEADETATLLVNAANAKGGKDNITVAIVDVVPRGYVRRNPFESLRGVSPAEYPVLHERADEETTISLPTQTAVHRQTLYDKIRGIYRTAKDNAHTIFNRAKKYSHNKIIEMGDEFFREFDYIYATAEGIAKSPQLNKTIDDINKELTTANTAIEGFGRHLLLNSREIFKRRTAFLGRMSGWIDDLISEFGREPEAVPVTVESRPETYAEYYDIATNTYFASRIRDRATDTFGATREIPAGSDEKALKALRTYVETTGWGRVLARWGLNRYFIGLPQSVIDTLHMAFQGSALSEILTELYKKPEHEQAAVLVFRQELGYTRLSRETTAEVLNLLRDAQEASLSLGDAIEQIHFLALAVPRFFKQNDIATVVNSSTQILSRSQKNILGHINAVVAYYHGQQALAEGRLEDAEDNFQAVLRRDDRYLRFVGIDMEEVYVGLARVYYSQRRFDKLKQVCDTSPHRDKLRTFILEVIENLHSRAMGAAEAGELQKARIYLRQILTIEPSHSSTLLEIARTYRTEGRIADSTTYYQQALELNPTALDLREEFARMLIDARNFALAGRLYQPIKGQNNALTQLYAGWMTYPIEKAEQCIAQGDFKKAREYARRTIELESGDLEHIAQDDIFSRKAIFRIANAYRLEGRTTDARNMYRRFLQFPEINEPNFNQAETYYRIAQTYATEGRTRDAQNYFRLAVQKDPQHRAKKQIL